MEDLLIFYLYLGKLKLLTHGQLYYNLGHILNSNAFFQNLLRRGL